MKDQLILGEMPPKKKPQPPFAERKEVIDRMTATLKLAYAQNRSTGGRAVIRRLNKFEMRNTLRDLFHLNHPAVDPHGDQTRAERRASGALEGWRPQGDSTPFPWSDSSAPRATDQVQRARVLDPARLRLRRPDPLGVSNRDALEDMRDVSAAFRRESPLCPTACLVNPESYTLATLVEVGPLKVRRGDPCLFVTQPYP